MTSQSSEIETSGAIEIDRRQQVQEAKAHLLAKQEYAVKDKPLAIELARKKRQKVTISSKNEQTFPGSISLDIKPEDLGFLNNTVNELFQASVFQRQVGDDSAHAIVSSHQNEVDEEEDDIEWENVKPDVFEEKTNCNITSARVEHRVESSVTESERSVTESAEIEWEEIASLPRPPQNTVSPAEVVDQIGDEKSSEVSVDIEMANEEEVEEANELFASLQEELDEERSEQDLQSLKQEALKSAMSTASNLTQWAAGAVRRALEAHTRGSDIDADTTSKLVENDNIIDLTNEVAQPEPEIVNGDEMNDDEMLEAAIKESLVNETTHKGSRYLHYNESPSQKQSITIDTMEQDELKRLRNRQMRDVDGMNDSMVHDVMELLRLFGVPFLVCPMEAEAQCATLEQLGIVDGIITDDSDIFLFGGQHVYKNIFHHQKFVEAFDAKDIESELGFTQDEMISLGLLLGSDYTDGIRGIGIVNATEVINAYPGGIEGLKEFKEWVLSFNVQEETQRREEKKSIEELNTMTRRERFQYTHASIRRKWELGETFPNPYVVKAYKSPQVDRSKEKFQWNVPDIAGLRTYCANVFGWEQAKSDAVLLPLIQQGRNPSIQTRIDQFFTKYDDNVKYATIQSKRLRTAVKEKSNKDDKTLPNRKIYTKTKKTISTLGQ